MSTNIAPEVVERLMNRCTPENRLSNGPEYHIYAPFGTSGRGRGEVRNMNMNGLIVVTAHSNTSDEQFNWFGHLHYDKPSTPDNPEQLIERADKDATLTEDERDAVKTLLRSQQRPSSPSPATTPATEADWDQTYLYDWGLVTVVSTSEYYEVAENHLTANEPRRSPSKSPWRNRAIYLSEDRATELAEKTMNGVEEYAYRYAKGDSRETLVDAPDGALGDALGISIVPGKTIVVRECKKVDVLETATNLYRNAPQITQKQAVVWALASAELQQSQIAALCGMNQSSVSDHLSRAARTQYEAERTTEAFDSVSNSRPDRHPQFEARTIRHVEKELADRDFEMNKSRDVAPLRCPECGRDTGEYEGSFSDGDWVDEPQTFHMGSWMPQNVQKPSDPRYVECPDCGYSDQQGSFTEAWKEVHGRIPDSPRFSPPGGH